MFNLIYDTRISPRLRADIESLWSFPYSTSKLNIVFISFQKYKIQNLSLPKKESLKKFAVSIFTFTLWHIEIKMSIIFSKNFKFYLNTTCLSSSKTKYAMSFLTSLRVFGISFSNTIFVFIALFLSSTIQK